MQDPLVLGNPLPSKDAAGDAELLLSDKLDKLYLGNFGPYLGFTSYRMSEIHTFALKEDGSLDQYLGVTQTGETGGNLSMAQSSAGNVYYSR